MNNVALKVEPYGIRFCYGNIYDTDVPINLQLCQHNTSLFCIRCVHKVIISNILAHINIILNIAK